MYGQLDSWQQFKQDSIFKCVQRKNLLRADISRKFPLDITYRRADLSNPEEMQSIAANDAYIPALYDPLFKVDDKAILDRLQKLMKCQPDDFFDVAMADDKKIVGFHMMTQFKSTHGVMAANIETLWVDPRYRQQGIAKILKERGEQWAKRHELDHISSFVHCKNPSMLSLNEKLGYELVGYKLRKSLVEHSKTTSKAKLIRLLQNAYSGEKAAAYAYRGHSLSVTDPQEREEIRKIEQDEWDHRQCIGEMLKSLQARPRVSREFLMSIIGISIYSICRLGGWFNIGNLGWYMSMYGAGKLEQGNIIEYEIGAREAIACNEHRFVEDLIHMAEVEWDHELYFRSKALSSRWKKLIKIWMAPPARESGRQAIGNLRYPTYETSG